MNEVPLYMEMQYNEIIEDSFDINADAYLIICLDKSVDIR